MGFNSLSGAKKGVRPRLKKEDLRPLKLKKRSTSPNNKWMQDLWSLSTKKYKPKLYIKDKSQLSQNNWTWVVEGIIIRILLFIIWILQFDTIRLPTNMYPKMNLKWFCILKYMNEFYDSIRLSYLLILILWWILYDFISPILTKNLESYKLKLLYKF